MRPLHVSTGGIFWQCLPASRWTRVCQAGELPACHFNLGPRHPWGPHRERVAQVLPVGGKVFGLTREFAESARMPGLTVF